MSSFVTYISASFIYAFSSAINYKHNPKNAVLPELQFEDESAEDVSRNVLKLLRSTFSWPQHNIWYSLATKYTFRGD